MPYRKQPTEKQHERYYKMQFGTLWGQLLGKVSAYQLPSALRLRHACQSSSCLQQLHGSQIKTKRTLRSRPFSKFVSPLRTLHKVILILRGYILCKNGHQAPCDQTVLADFYLQNLKFACTIRSGLSISSSMHSDSKGRCQRPCAEPIDKHHSGCLIERPTCHWTHLNCVAFFIYIYIYIYILYHIQI